MIEKERDSDRARTVCLGGKKIPKVVLQINK